MSGWEIFTWLNVAILGVGSVAVFVAFLVKLPELLRRPPSERSGGVAGPPSPPGDG